MSRHQVFAAFEAEGRDYIAWYSVSGGYAPATRDDDASYPEVELCRVEVDEVGGGVVPEADYERLGIERAWLDGELAERVLWNLLKGAPGSA
jgi:hypothetical protein